MLLDGQTTTLSLIDRFWKIFETVAQKIFKKKGSVDIFKDLEKEFESLTDLSFQNLLKGVETGFQTAVIDNAPDELMLENLRNNVQVFSGFKTYQQLRQATDLLWDKNQKIKPFGQYLEDVRKLNKTYNEHYLRAEYNHSIASAQQASIWQDRELFDLQFDAVNDKRTRSSHARLDGIVRPVEDEFWDKYYPLLDWNCRCIARKIRKGSKKLSNVSKFTGEELKPMFRVNTAKQGVVFPEKHPYYKIQNPKDKKTLQKWIDATLGKEVDTQVQEILLSNPDFKASQEQVLKQNLHKKVKNLSLFEASTVYYYTEDGFKNLNKRLTFKKKPSDFLKQVDNVLSQALSKLLKYKNTVYRAKPWERDKLDPYFEAYENQKPLTEPVYLSTSKSEKVAREQFNCKTLFIIESKTGRSIAKVSSYDNNPKSSPEFEVLLPKNKQFNVTNIKKEGDKFIIYMTEL